MSLGGLSGSPGSTRVTVVPFDAKLVSLPVHSTLDSQLEFVTHKVVVEYRQDEEEPALQLVYKTYRRFLEYIYNHL